MRIVLQRVTRAEVSVDKTIAGQIGKGLVALIGVHTGDTPHQAVELARKCAQLRIFSDAVGKMNLSLIDIGGALLVVSQFTLIADTSRGRRPSFIDAAPPTLGDELYRRFIDEARTLISPVQTGVFGADMQLSLTNDGPVTIILDSSAPAST